MIRLDETLRITLNVSCDLIMPNFLLMLGDLFWKARQDLSLAL